MAGGVRLAGLWTKQAPNGEQYFEGSLGGSAVIRVYANKYKQTEKQPDYVIYLNNTNQDQKRQPAVQPKAQPQAHQPNQTSRIQRAPPQQRPQAPANAGTASYVESPADDSPWPDNEYGPSFSEPPF